MTIQIFTRPQGGGYIATVKGHGYRASSTNSPEVAAQNVAMKFKLGLRSIEGHVFEDQCISLACVGVAPFGNNKYSASWIG